jgi:unsaturated chondroitin disaccharide hydrolase
MRKMYKVIIASLFFIGINANSLYSQNLDSLVQHSLQFASQQLAESIVEIGDTTRYAYRTREDGTTDEGKWRTNGTGSWVSGWFPGCLWQIYGYTSDEFWKQQAIRWTEGLESVKNNTKTHDVGFIMFCSFGNGYHQTGNETYKDILLKAAESLSTRYNSTTGIVTVKTSSEGLWLMMDTMPNIELLIWASQNGGQSAWYDMVVSHSLKSIEDLFREDGSSYQDVYYDPSTCDMLKRGNHQGYNDASTWSRGHAWGMYGFPMVYRYTKDIRFLEAAQKLADYFIDNLPNDNVTFWDFDSPDTLKDVSATAIGVSGLLELSTQVSDEKLQQKYWNASQDILASLCSPPYLAEGSIHSGILLHGIQNYNSDKGMDVSLIHADYYFIEALLRYQDITTSISEHDYSSFSIPVSIQLYENYPNPFNAETTIRYFIPYSTNISLNIYDVTGRLVQNLIEEYQERGEYSYQYNGTHLSSGIYFVVLQVENIIESQKMILIK